MSEHFNTRGSTEAAVDHLDSLSVRHLAKEYIGARFAGFESDLRMVVVIDGAVVKLRVDDVWTPNTGIYVVLKDFDDTIDTDDASTKAYSRDYIIIVRLFDDSMMYFVIDLTPGTYCSNLNILSLAVEALH